MQRATDLVEEMDKLDCDEERLYHTFDHFRWMNPLLSNWKWLFNTLIYPRFSTYSQIKLLDIGCGGGDVLLYLKSLFKEKGIKVEAIGVDPDSRLLQYFEQKSKAHSWYKACYSWELEETFDLIVCNHLLHHLNEDNLRKMLNHTESILNSQGFALFNDLSRSFLAYVLYSIIALPLHINSFAWVDGRRSIKRAYTKSELKTIAPKVWSVESHGLFRQYLSYSKDA